MTLKKISSLVDSQEFFELGKYFYNINLWARDKKIFEIHLHGEKTDFPYSNEILTHGVEDDDFYTLKIVSPKYKLICITIDKNP